MSAERLEVAVSNASTAPQAETARTPRLRHFAVPSIFAAIIVAISACGRGKITGPPVALNGVSIDLPKLQQACGSSNPTIRDSIDKVRLSIRYADYRTALAELAKLANNPDITEAQKKTVNDVSEQVKQAFASATPSTANAGP